MLAANRGVNWSGRHASSALKMESVSAWLLEPSVDCTKLTLGFPKIEPSRLKLNWTVI
jgi:hypothetical protein